MRTMSIMAGGALLALAIGTTAAVAQPMGSVPPAGAYYGSAPPMSPGYSQWQPAPQPRPRMERSGYRRPERSASIGDISRDPTYAVNDWQAWGLTPPAPGMHWLRYYNDAVLVDARGHVVDARYGIGWDMPRGGMAPGARGPGYAGGPGYGPGSGAPGYGAPGYGAPGYGDRPGVWHDPNGGTTVYHAGPNTTVTTQVIGGAPGYGYGYGGAYPVGAGTLIITPGSVVTTTTTTSEEEVYHNAYHRPWHRPVRHYRPRCVQAPTCPVTGS